MAFRIKDLIINVASPEPLCGPATREEPAAAGEPICGPATREEAAAAGAPVCGPATRTEPAALCGPATRPEPAGICGPATRIDPAALCGPATRLIGAQLLCGPATRPDTLVPLVALVTLAVAGEGASQDLSVLKQQLRDALARIEEYERSLQGPGMPETVGEAEDLETRLKEALDELSEHKKKLKK